LNGRSQRSLVTLFLILVVVVLATTTLSLAVGIQADRRWGTAPWFTLAGMVIGVTFASLGIWWTVRRRYFEIAPQAGRRKDDKEVED